MEDGEIFSFDREYRVGFEVFTVVYVEILICSLMTPRHWATGFRHWEGTRFALGLRGRVSQKEWTRSDVFGNCVMNQRCSVTSQAT
jgi:hypothetical protein